MWPSVNGQKLGYENQKDLAHVYKALTVQA